MERLSRILIVLALAALVGCQGGETAAPESATSKEEAKAAASTWTPEQRKIFEEENKKGRGVAGADSAPAVAGDSK